MSAYSVTRIESNHFSIKQSYISSLKFFIQFHRSTLKLSMKNDTAGHVSHRSLTGKSSTPLATDII